MKDLGKELTFTKAVYFILVFENQGSMANRFDNWRISVTDSNNRAILFRTLKADYHFTMNGIYRI
jgi:hypothetical protein